MALFLESIILTDDKVFEAFSIYIWVCLCPLQVYFYHNRSSGIPHFQDIRDDLQSRRGSQTLYKYMKVCESTEVNELLPVTPKTTSINTNTRIHTTFSFLILPQSYIFTCGDNHQHPLGCFRVSSWPAGALCGCVCVLKRLLPLGSLCQYSVSVGQQHGAIRPAPTASPQNALHTNRTNSYTFTYWTALLLGAFVRPLALSCSL